VIPVQAPDRSAVDRATTTTADAPVADGTVTVESHAE
jgi:hypothetical protein